MRFMRSQRQGRAGSLLRGQLQAKMGGADFLRRGIQADAFTMITFVGTNSNTRWICEKNMQGPPFMEVIIHAPFGPARFRMSKDFEAL